MEISYVFQLLFHLEFITDESCSNDIWTLGHFQNSSLNKLKIRAQKLPNQIRDTLQFRDLTRFLALKYTEDSFWIFGYVTVLKFTRPVALLRDLQPEGRGFIVPLVVVHNYT